jgi:hypothetical protein
VAGAWGVSIPPGVQAQLSALLEIEGEPCYDEALDRIADLREDPTPTDAALLRNARDHYRIYVCKGAGDLFTACFVDGGVSLWFVYVLVEPRTRGLTVGSR